MHSFHWAPVLTFNDRRLACLRWIESNLDVFGFLDADDEFGVSAEHRGLRVVVTRSGMDLLLGAPDVDAERARPLIRGVLEGFIPRDLHLFESRALFSVAVDEDSAAEAATQAQKWFAPRDGYAAYDFANLLDVHTPGADIMVEFGVVDRTELKFRLTRTEVGRVRLGAEMPAVTGLPANLPATAYFFDVKWVTQSSDDVANDEDADIIFEYIKSRLDLSIQESVTVVEQIASKMGRGGHRGELGRGA